MELQFAPRGLATSPERGPPLLGLSRHDCAGKLCGVLISPRATPFDSLEIFSNGALNALEWAGRPVVENERSFPAPLNALWRIRFHWVSGALHFVGQTLPYVLHSQPAHTGVCRSKRVES